MFNVDKFRTHFGKHEDFAKSSRFEVRIAAPPGAPDLTNFASDLRFQCESSELPGYTINTVDNRIYGVPNPVASTASFADITMTFICAGDLWEKKFFDRWMDIIIPINNYNPKYKDDYASPKIVINQYSDIAKDDSQPSEPTAETQLRYSAILHGAFPISVAPLGLNWADDQFLKLSVTFKYEYWTQGTAKAPAGSDRIQRLEAQPSGSVLQKAIPDRSVPQLPSFTGGGGGKFGGGGASGRW
jgi:hypothetical protein